MTIDARRMGKSELFSHFAERFEVKRTQAREFFDELTALAEKELKRSGEFVLPADKAIVWAKLNDAETLRASIPGCESLEKLSDTEMQAAVKIKIGPVSARFKGKVNLTDIDAPNSYRISGQGDGGIAGFAKGGASVNLTEKDGGTLLTYNVEAQIGGKLAQLGQRLVNGAAKKLADDFFTKFAAAVKA